MAVVTISDLRLVETPITIAGHAQTSAKPSRGPAVRIIQHHNDLVGVLGKSAKHTLVLSSSDSSGNPFFHSGCVFNSATNELWATSAPLQTTNSSSLPVVLISKIALDLDPTHKDPAVRSLTWQKLRSPPTMLMPAGGISYDGGVLWAARGVPTPNTAGIVLMKQGKPPQALARSYHGREFNSPHAVAASKGDGVWFTDPYMTPLGEWRPRPSLPQQVYRLDRVTGEVRSMADGFHKPTGIAVCPKEDTLYVADSGPEDDDSASLDSLRVAGVYAFDIVSRRGSPFVANRRLFAKSLDGSPTCVKCDVAGNVYIASGKHLEIWSAGGSLLGLVEVPAVNPTPGSASVFSFSFGWFGDIFICAGQHLWRVVSGVSPQECPIVS